MSTLVIMPTYNELGNVEAVVGEVLALNPELEVLVVDDNSPDGTASSIREMSLRDPRVHLLERSTKAGLGPAYIAGFSWGFERGFEYMVEMDADGSHRPKDLELLLNQEADLVIGSRWVEGGKVVNWPFHRELISRIGNWYARKMLGTGIFDMTSGFRVYRSECLKSIDLSKVASQGYSFQVELAYLISKIAKVSEVPIVFVERLKGKSKMTIKIVIEALFNVTRWGLSRLVRN